MQVLIQKLIELPLPVVLAKQTPFFLHLIVMMAKVCVILL